MHSMFLYGTPSGIQAEASRVREVLRNPCKAREKMRSPCSTRCRVPLGTVLTPRGAYEAYEAYEVSVPYLEVIHADSWPHI
jgi:hypothetical protein